MNRLRDLRTNRRLSIRELANLVHIDFTTISRLENGISNFNEQYTKIFAEFFGVTADYLLGLDTNQDLTDQFTDFQYALYGETKNLNEEQQKDLMQMVKIFKKQLEKKNE